MNAEQIKGMSRGHPSKHRLETATKVARFKQRSQKTITNPVIKLRRPKMAMSGSERSEDAPDWLVPLAPDPVVEVPTDA